MYLAHFGFKAQPFSIAPNPRLLYLSKHHQEALAHLTYGVESGGFVVLTGEVGTGKTTLCRALLSQVPDNCELALILNPMLSVTELLAAICDELRIRPRLKSNSKILVDAINRHLLKVHAEGKKTVLIIDEAQNLDADVLEQLRLLTNLETDERKLMQIILLGQPELNDKLANRELRQLSQRITARYHLTHLGFEETKTYIRFRLNACGVHRQLFEAAAVKALFKASLGIPRLINTIADRALLGAYAQNRDTVDRSLVKSAAREILGRSSYWKNLLRQPQLIVATSLVGLAVLLPAILLPLLYRDTELEPQIPPPKPPVQLTETADSATAELQNNPATTRTPSPAAERAANAIAQANPALAASTGNVQKPPPVVLDRPTNLTPENALGYSFTVLFSRWNINYSPAYDGEPCLFAARNGLQCYTALGNLDQLQNLNRPALLNLTAMDDKVRLPIALIGLSDNAAVVTVGKSIKRLEPAVLNERWGGSYTLLWSPPRSYTAPLNAEESGPLVPWLATRRAQLENTPIRTSWTLSGNLLEWLMNFQRSNGLESDGAAGPATIIALQNALDRNYTPGLNVNLVK